jgi:hypothetical protein
MTTTNGPSGPDEAGLGIRFPEAWPVARAYAEAVVASVLH